MQIKGCTGATRKLRVTTRICKCECEMHCFVACRMLESNTIGWSFCKNPPPTPTLNTSTWSIKADWGLKWHETGPWAMSFLDSTKALPCESVHWKGTSLWVNFLKALTTLFKFGQNPARKFSIRHTENCFYYGWGWADPFRVKLESRKNHFWGLDLYLAGFSSSSTCCIRSRKLWRFSSWSFSASSCVISHPYLRTRSAMFRDLSFLPGLPAVSFDIPRFAGDSLGQT